MRRTAARLDDALAGQSLVTADIRVPRFATVHLRGAEVVGTTAVGKHLLTRLVRDSNALTLHSHLRMEGRWVVGRASSRPCAGPAHEVRVWLLAQRNQAVGLRLSQVAVVPTTSESRLVGHLGPDIMAADFDPVRGAELIRARGGDGLVSVLLDQTVVCGMGTMWAAELAHRIGASPWRAAGSVPGPELAAGLAEIRTRMWAAVAEQPRESRARLAVFERQRQPCRVCGAQIRRGRVGRAPQDRVTYWCPHCQPDGS